MKIPEWAKSNERSLPETLYFVKTLTIWSTVSLALSFVGYSFLDLPAASASIIYFIVTGTALFNAFDSERPEPHLALPSYEEARIRSRESHKFAYLVDDKEMLSKYIENEGKWGNKKIDHFLSHLPSTISSYVREVNNLTYKVPEVTDMYVSMFMDMVCEENGYNYVNKIMLLGKQGYNLSFSDQRFFSKVSAARNYIAALVISEFNKYDETISEYNKSVDVLNVLADGKIFLERA